LSTIEKAGIGIGAGAVAGIIIAGVVFLLAASYGSKKGYDAYVRHRAVKFGANTNPMYTGTYHVIKNVSSHCSR
jgi:hypothetical protein